jgi:hypothetical protein
MRYPHGSGRREISPQTHPEVRLDEAYLSKEVIAYHTTKHAKFLNLAHLILTRTIPVCKYRKKHLIPFGDAIQSTLRKIAGANRVHTLEMGVDKDPIHREC